MKQFQMLLNAMEYQPCIKAMSILQSKGKKSTAGAIIPLGEASWLKWSCDKDNTLG